MAWYNPQPVSFTPNSEIIKQAGAVGTFLYDKAQQDYQRAMEAKDRQFLLDKFTYQQGQDKITNDNWQKDYDQEQQKFIAGEGWKNLDDAYREKTYKLDKDKLNEQIRQNNIAEKASAAKLAQERNQNIAKGAYIAQQDPEFVESMGGITKKQVMDKPIAEAKYNPFIQQILGDTQGISTPQQIMQPEYMSVPTYKTQTSYNPDVLANIGGAGINIKDNNSKSEFITLTNMLDNETNPEKRKMLQDRITKLTQADMNSKLIGWNAVESQANSFANTLGATNMYELASIKIPTERQAEASILGDKIFDIYKADNKQISKNISDIEAEYTQLQYANEALQKVGDIRFVDEAVKSVFSNYFGLSEKEMQSTEAAQALQSALNIAIRVDSGASVTNNELERKILETATNYQHKDKIILGLKNMARRKIGALEGLKRINPVAFNLKYGQVLENYKTLYDTVSGSAKNDSGWTSVVKKQPQTITIDQAASLGISFE